MANRNYPSARTMNHEHDPVRICGHFSVGGGAIVANSRFGNGWTVAYTAAGRYTITTDNPFRHVVSATATFSPTTAVDSFLVPLPPGGGAGAAVTWEIRLWALAGGAGGLADPAAATDEIHFDIILSNSQLDRAAW